MQRKFLQIHLEQRQAIADLAVAYLEKKQAGADALTYLFSTTYTEADVVEANAIGVKRREHARKKRAGGIKQNPDDHQANQYEMEGVLGELLAQKLFAETTEATISFAPLFSENRAEFGIPDITLDGVKYDIKTASSRYQNLAINVNSHSQAITLHGISYYIALHFSAEFVADWYVVKAGAVGSWEVKELWRNTAPFYRGPFPRFESSL